MASAAEAAEVAEVVVVPAAGAAADRSAVEVRAVGAVAAGAAGAGSVATPERADSSDRGGSLATAPGVLSGRDPGGAAGCRSQSGIYVAKDRNHDSQPRWPAASA